MLRLEGLSKGFWVKGQWYCVLNNVTFTFPSDRNIALLGANGAGKSTLLRLLAGTLYPSAGRIVRQGRISWPVGFAGSFHRDLTGAQNTRFLARTYGVDTQSLLRFVADFSELGVHFNVPVRHYSSGMIARLAFSASMGVGFDIYLIDEITAVGDAYFREKSAALLAQRLQSARAIIVNHNMAEIRRLCRSGAILRQGQLQYFDDIDEAIAAHQEQMLMPKTPPRAQS